MTTGIQWTDCTWNPVIGCTPVSLGCLNCYAATMANRLRSMPSAKNYHDIVEPPDTRSITQIQREDFLGYVRAAEKKQGRTLRIAEVRGEGRDNRRAVFTGDVRCLDDELSKPLKWRKARRVFVCSMGDLFHESVPQHFIHEVLHVIKQCPQHTFQILTKRPERAASIEWVCAKYGEDYKYLPNVWLGASAEDQKTLDERVPHLLSCPAAVRFLSCEPLLGSIKIGFDRPVLTDLMDATGKRDERHRGQYPFTGVDPDRVTRRKDFIHWVIAGGESGHRARPCNIEHVRSIKDKCASAGVACFVKQLGARPMLGSIHDTGLDWPQGTRFGSRDGEPHGRAVLLRDSHGGDMAEWPEDLRVREFPMVVAGTTTAKKDTTQ